jgi:hypothetical protein
MPRIAIALCVALVLSLVAPAGGVVAQSTGTVTVTVTVHDRSDDPISNADLDVEWDGGSTTATTAANGKAFVDVPEGARVTVAVTHPRYVRTGPYVIEDASEREVEIEVSRRSSVRLEISDDDGSVADARVRIVRGGLGVSTGTTDRNGVFESDDLPAGDYTVVVSKAGYYTREKPLEIEGDITNRVALRRGSTTVNIRVVDPYFDPPRPVSTATVSLADTASEQTGRSGNVSVTAPVNTETTLHVTKDGYRSVEREVTVGEAPTNVSVQFSRTRSITLEAANERVVAGERVILTATDAYGNPAAVATVYLDGERVGTTDGEGEAAIRIEESGMHTLYVTKGGVESNEVEVEAIAADGATPTATGSGTPTPTVAATPTTTSTPTETGGTSPGFGPPLVVLALLVLGGLAVRASRTRR